MPTLTAPGPSPWYLRARSDSETGKATCGQLADYIGIVALARVDLSADFSGADSILRLFATTDAATPPPAKLTEFDYRS